MFIRRHAQNAHTSLAACRCHEDFHELGVHDPAQQPRAVRVPVPRRPEE